MGKDTSTEVTSTGRDGGEGGEKPSLNNSSQLRQGQKTMELLPGNWRTWEGFSKLKSYEIIVENCWELCRMLDHAINDYVTLDIYNRLLHTG